MHLPDPCYLTLLMLDRLMLVGGVLALLCISTGASIAASDPDLPPVPAPPAPGDVPARIASIALSADEALLSLLPPSRLLCVGPFADDPDISNVAAHARRVPHRPGRDPEQLVALRPDVVFSDPFVHPETRALLRRTGVPVLELESATSFAGIARNLRWVAIMVDREEQAEEILARMDASLASTAELVQGADRPRVLPYDTGGYTAGAGTLVDEIVRRAGGRNAAAEADMQGHTALSLERALGLDADVLLVTHYRADAKARAVVPEPSLEHDPIWSQARAVREGRVLRVPARLIQSTSHHAATAVRELAHALHPERFPERATARASAP